MPRNNGYVGAAWWAAAGTFCALLATAAGQVAEPPVQAEPLSPEAALRRFQLEPGLKIELVAAEPLVRDPVDIAFDETGRMYVAEALGYNREGMRPRSRIRMLEDVDRDGRMDRASTFADDLDHAQGVLAMRGGVLVTTNSAVLFLRDRDGDRVADVRETIRHCSESIRVDAQMGSPRRGMDNAVYINNGLGGKEVHRPEPAPERLKLGNYNLRYDPASGAIAPASGRGQFGNTFDDWGRQFFTVNRNPVQFAVMPYRFLVRNRSVLLVDGHEDVAPSRGESRVYPLQTFRTTSSAHAGTFTSACGISAFRGDRLGAGFEGNLFVCEPTGALVSRWVLHPAGASFKAERTATGREFLASDDEWFRPVNTATGPDGALYVVDMYRRFIDGRRFFPDEYAKTNDMGAGVDRGRIYRIFSAAGPRPVTGGPLPTDPMKRVALLEHPNGWYRDTAQRLLVEAGNKDVRPALDAMMATGGGARARLHALWTIEGLGLLTAGHVARMLEDPESRVVENAVWLAERFAAGDEELQKKLIALTRADSGRVRFAAVLVVGGLEPTVAWPVLQQAGQRESEDAWTRAAIMSSPATQSAALLAGLVSASEFRGRATAGRVDLVKRLAQVVAVGGQPAGLATLFRALNENAAVPSTGSRWRT